MAKRVRSYPKGCSLNSVTRDLNRRFGTPTSNVDIMFIANVISEKLKWGKAKTRSDAWVLLNRYTDEMLPNWRIRRGVPNPNKISANKANTNNSSSQPKQKNHVKEKSYEEFCLFYKSRPWRILRMKAIKKYGRTCMCCGATDKPIHVDHIKPRSKYPELELDITNLQILCEDCNMGKGGWDETDWRNERDDVVSEDAVRLDEEYRAVMGRLPN